MDRLLQHYVPYSDFEFAPLWAWGTGAQIAWSDGYEAVALRLTGYADDQPFVTVLAPPTLAREACDRVVDLIAATDRNVALRYVPAEVANALDPTAYAIMPQRDHADYIFDLRQHLTFAGKRFRPTRHKLNRFRERHPRAIEVPLDLADYDCRRAIFRLWDRWTARRGGDVPNETRAFERFLPVADRFPVCATGIVVDGDLVAFSVAVLSATPDYANSLFEKADTDYDGAYGAIASLVARALVARGRHLLNAQEDLGYPNLRLAKSVLGPTAFLHKCDVAPMRLPSPMGAAPWPPDRTGGRLRPHGSGVE